MFYGEMKYINKRRKSGWSFLKQDICPPYFNCLFIDSCPNCTTRDFRVSQLVQTESSFTSPEVEGVIAFTVFLLVLVPTLQAEIAEDHKRSKLKAVALTPKGKVKYLELYLYCLFSQLYDQSLRSRVYRNWSKLRAVSLALK